MRKNKHEKQGGPVEPKSKTVEVILKCNGPTMQSQCMNQQQCLSPFFPSAALWLWLLGPEDWTLRGLSRLCHKNL